MTPEANTEEQKQAPEAQAKHGLGDLSMKLAGGSFLAADTALFAYALSKGNKKIGTAAVFGFTEGAVGAVFGNPKVETQLKQLERHLGGYLRQQGVKIPKDPTVQSLTKEGGVIDHIGDFLYKYPSQIMNICYAMIGVNFARDGLDKVKHHTKAGGYEMLASGALILGGALGGLLIKEKKFDAEHPASTLWEKVQEKPLRVTGTMLNLNVLLQFVSVFKEGKEAHKTGKLQGKPADKKYIYRLLAASAFAFGNTMLAMSSTGYGGSAKGADPKLIEKISDLSASVIAAQPKETQEALLEHVSGYLASQPNMKMKAADISDILHKKLAEITAQPQVAGGWAERTLASSGQGSAPAL